MKFAIRDRWTGDIQFEAEIECDEYASIAIKIGLSVKWALKSGAYLRDANLSGAYLSGTYLSGVPKIENIHQEIYAASSTPGALEMGVWHTCDMTHCRAGWAVMLAGEEGTALEARLGTAVAGALIYLASDPALERIPDWYASNAEALADMKRLADAEASRTNVAI